eukprot:2846300-Lingulodinium_polyedra.AAC.1
MQDGEVPQSNIHGPRRGRGKGGGDGGGDAMDTDQTQRGEVAGVAPAASKMATGSRQLRAAEGATRKTRGPNATGGGTSGRR